MHDPQQRHGKGERRRDLLESIAHSRRQERSSQHAKQRQAGQEMNGDVEGVIPPDVSAVARVGTERRARADGHDIPDVRWRERIVHCQRQRSHRPARHGHLRRRGHRARQRPHAFGCGDCRQWPACRRTRTRRTRCCQTPRARRPRAREPRAGPWRQRTASARICLAGADLSASVSYPRSTARAIPSPPLTQSVARPRFAPRRAIS